jgi:hypothetical protein
LLTGSLNVAFSIHGIGVGIGHGGLASILLGSNPSLSAHEKGTLRGAFPACVGTHRFRRLLTGSLNVAFTTCGKGVVIGHGGLALILLGSNPSLSAQKESTL